MFGMVTFTLVYLAADPKNPFGKKRGGRALKTKITFCPGIPLAIYQNIVPEMVQLRFVPEMVRLRVFWRVGPRGATVRICLHYKAV